MDWSEEASFETVEQREDEALTRVLVITPAADRDLEEIAVFLGRDSMSAADRFVDAAHRAFQHILDMPMLGSKVLAYDPVLTDLRRGRIARFPNHLIFYRIIDESIEIVRILHGARDIDRLLSADA